MNSTPINKNADRKTAALIVLAAISHSRHNIKAEAWLTRGSRDCEKQDVFPQSLQGRTHGGPGNLLSTKPRPATERNSCEKFTLATGCLLLAAAAIMLLAQPAAVHAQANASRFDHLTTGFELEGAHRDAPCESCHVDAMFKGTPRDCRGCHATASRIRATAKPMNHIMSSDACGDCHSTLAFSPADRFDHLQVRGSCVSCHNNVQATGKPLGHVASDNNCDACHSTTAWTPARFDHSSVVPGTCSTCHNGVRATGKPMTHVPTTTECDGCHSTLAWTPAMFDHTGVMGACQSCHNGSAATGKNVGHMTTSRECNICHSISGWTPLIFVHSSPEYPGDHRRNLQCTDCHTTNTDMASWPAIAYRPDCAGCHANDYKADPHLKIANTNTRYTVSELRNCSGACHVYTDASLTTISRSRPGPQHRVNGGGFD